LRIVFPNFLFLLLSGLDFFLAILQRSEILLLFDDGLFLLELELVFLQFVNFAANILGILQDDDFGVPYLIENVPSLILPINSLNKSSTMFLYSCTYRRLDSFLSRAIVGTKRRISADWSAATLLLRTVIAASFLNGSF
jgi:hypothetical protein